jgi:hypothetical protein
MRVAVIKNMETRDKSLTRMIMIVVDASRHDLGIPFGF